MLNLWHSDDARWMRVALSHGARGLGHSWPNPSVGCVIVKNGQLLAVATTAPGGRPHAETQALAIAGDAARGATAYVTLEPCAHHGKTPPCAEALIQAGIARVVMGAVDPDKRVARQGIALLEHAGILVVEAPEPFASEAAAQHAGFFTLLREKRPTVALKLATGLDGAIATASGESQWITGEAARAHAHGLRAQYDAILTGIGTVQADNPRLTCRLPGMQGHSPVRVVMDTSLKLALDAALLDDLPDVKLWLLTSMQALAEQSDKADALRAKGVELLPCRMDGDQLDVADALARLGGQGITRLLVEAGPRITAAFLESGLVSTIYWYRAPMLLGRGARHGAQPAFSAVLADLPRWQPVARQPLGQDMLEIFALPAVSA